MPATAPASVCALIAVLALVAPAEPAKSQTKSAAKTEVDAGETIEIVVETKKRPDWLFPTLDHPRVQAFFNSRNDVGPSLFDQQSPAQRRPLVRAGTISVKGAATRAERKLARRFARELVARARPSLEACYRDSLGRKDIDAARLTFHVDLDGRDRSAVRVKSGVLGDVHGNACVHGVLEFVDLEVPTFVAAIDIPVWFWLQTA